jgi:hypothetical protein
VEAGGIVWSRYKDVCFMLVMLKQCIMGLAFDLPSVGVGCVTIWHREMRDAPEREF